MRFFSKKIVEISSIGFADIIGSGISAIFWFYVASVLGPEKYGEISYFISIAGLASTISLMGSSNTITVFTAKNIPIQSALYILTLFAGIISSIVVFLLFFNFGTSFLILMYIIFGLVIAEILGKKLYKTYAKFVILQRLLMVSLSIGLYYMVGDNGILVGMALSMTPYVYGIIRGFLKNPIKFSLVRQKSGFIVNSYLQTLSGALSGSLDKIIIVPIFGFAILGNYSLGLQFFTLLTLLPTAGMKYLIPQDSSGIENVKIKKIFVILSIIIALIGFFMGPQVISLIFPKFIEAEEVIKIISFAVIPSTITMTYQSKFLGQEKSRNVLISSGIWTLTQIFGIIILGQIFQVNGIALALVLGATVSSIYCVLVDRLRK